MTFFKSHLKGGFIELDPDPPKSEKSESGSKSKSESKSEKQEPKSESESKKNLFWVASDSRPKREVLPVFSFDPKNSDPSVVWDDVPLYKKLRGIPRTPE